MGSCGVGKQDGWTSASDTIGVSGRWHGGHGGYGGGRGGGKCACQRKLATSQWVIIALLAVVIVLQLKQMRLL